MSNLVAVFCMGGQTYIYVYQPFALYVDLTYERRTYMHVSVYVCVFVYGVRCMYGRSYVFPDYVYLCIPGGFSTVRVAVVEI